MSLISEVPLSNVTVYRADYKRKIIPRPEPYVPVRDYNNPLAGPYEEYILPYRKYNALEKPNDYPEPSEYFEEVYKNFPNLRTHLKDPNGPRFDIIDHLYDNENRTIYMSSYGQSKELESKTRESRNKLRLPSDTNIPLTTQTFSYRDPKILVPECYAKQRIRPLADNLIPNEKERVIIGVKTGESDYMAHIGKTGEEIIEGKLHGDVNIRPQFSQDELLRAMLIRKE